MPIVRYTPTEAERRRMLAEFAAQPKPTEAEIEAQVAEDGDEWTDEDFARAIVVHPPTKPETIRALRTHLGLTQAEFALRFGFAADTLQQYEDGSLIPSGPARTLLRLIEVDPDAVMRLLDPRHTARTEPAG